MNRRIKLYAATLTISFLTLTAAAQTGNLPRLKKGENYKTVRVKMLKAGWKPFRAPDADECFDGDERCQGRPEMQSCAGTGMANCRFLWKRKGKTAVIFTIGEDASYDGYEFEK